MSPAHHPVQRWRILAFVVVVVGGVGIAAAVRGTPPPPAAPAGPVALVAAPDAESSAWYCAGQSTPTGPAVGSVMLTNTTSRPATAAITAVTDAGSSAHGAATVPAHQTVVPSLPAVSSGSWESETVVVDGGGVAVSQAVHGPLGWSQSPCVSTTSSHWYFPSGSTAASNQLDVALLNPTSTPVVVDLSFVTPTGVVHPIDDQGIVLQSGQLVSESVASVVQEVSAVSTVVSARTGRVVAFELERMVGGGAATGGLALLTGAATPQAGWSIPAAREVAQGSSEIDVLNPGSTPESVTVKLRLPSGPLAPLTSQVAPRSTWVLQTSAETRIPDGVTYSVTVAAIGGPGVVVGRFVAVPAPAASPQAGMALAVDGLTAGSATGQWVVPPPGTSAQLPVAGAAPALLALLNTSDGTETYRAFTASPSGGHMLATGTLPAGATALVSGSPLTAAGLDPIMVQSNGSMAVSEDVGPAGGVGVVTMPGISLAPPIGGS